MDSPIPSTQNSTFLSQVTIKCSHVMIIVQNKREGRNFKNRNCVLLHIPFMGHNPKIWSKLLKFWRTGFCWLSFSTKRSFWKGAHFLGNYNRVVSQLKLESISSLTLSGSTIRSGIRELSPNAFTRRFGGRLANSLITHDAWCEFCLGFSQWSSGASI